MKCRLPYMAVHGPSPFGVSCPCDSRGRDFKTPKTDFPPYKEGRQSPHGHETRSSVQEFYLYCTYQALRALDGRALPVL